MVGGIEVSVVRLRPNIDWQQRTVDIVIFPVPGRRALSLGGAEAHRNDFSRRRTCRPCRHGADDCHVPHAAYRVDAGRTERQNVVRDDYS